jgi:ABC-type Co2+ transport system permease subunit
VPRRLSIRLEAVFWVVSVLIIVSGLYNFDALKYKGLLKICFCIATTLVLVTSAMMFYALYQMKQTIQRMPRMKKAVNVKRMFNHSLSYIIYMSVYILYSAIYFFGDD